MFRRKKEGIQSRNRPDWMQEGLILSGDKPTKTKGEKVMGIVIAVFFLIAVSFIGWILFQVFGPS